MWLALCRSKLTWGLMNLRPQFVLTSMIFSAMFSHTICVVYIFSRSLLGEKLFFFVFYRRFWSFYAMNFFTGAGTAQASGQLSNCTNFARLLISFNWNFRLVCRQTTFCDGGFFLSDENTASKNHVGTAHSHRLRKKKTKLGCVGAAVVLIGHLIQAVSFVKVSR